MILPQEGAWTERREAAFEHQELMPVRGLRCVSAGEEGAGIYNTESIDGRRWALPAFHPHCACAGQCLLSGCARTSSRCSVSQRLTHSLHLVLIIALTKADFHRYAQTKQMISNTQEHY